MIMDEFLTDLQALIAKHKASLYYTTDDDGIHVKVGDDEMVIGYPQDGVMAAPHKPQD